MENSPRRRAPRDKKCRIGVPKRGQREKRKKKERWGDDDGYSSACTISFSCLVFVDRLQFHVFHGLIYLFSIAIACCSQFLNYWSGLCTLIYSWLEKNKSFISMALFVMLPVFFFF